MNSSNKKLVIFDFDGVLVNTIEFSFAEHQKLNHNLTYEKFQNFSNGNFHDGIMKAISDGLYIVPKNWDKIYTKNIEKIKIIDVLNQTIKNLSSNYLLSIVSASSTNVINSFLVKENIRNYFPDILGSDVHSDKTIKINSLFKKYNINPNDAIFITDSLGDILEANKCRVKCIGVTWGIHSRETLEKGNPVAVIDNPRDLLNCIKNVLK